jgi:hypothetical protein
MHTLYSRTFSKPQAAMSVAMPTSQRAPAPRPVTAVAAKPPQVLQSGHAPAQLSFTFTRW